MTAAVDQFSEPILEKLNAAKYRIIFNCYDRAYGSFNFRFETNVLPMPYIWVKLQDFLVMRLKFELHYKIDLIIRMINTLSSQLFEVIPVSVTGLKII